MNSAHRCLAHLDRGLDKLIAAGLLLLALTLYLRSDVRSSWRAVLLLMVCLAGVHVLIRGKALWQGLHPQIRPLLLFWLCFVLVTLLTAWTGNTFPASQQQLLQNFLLPASLPFLATLYLSDAGRLRLLGWAFLGGLCISLFRLAQYVEEWRLLGGLTNDIHQHRLFADSLVFGLPFLLAALASSRRFAWRYVAGLALCMTLGMILLTGARGAWLASGVGTLGFLLLRRDRNVLYTLLGLGLAGGVALALLGPGEIVAHKIQQGFDTSQRTSGTWGPSLAMIKDRPLLGYGFGSEVYHETFNHRVAGEPGWTIKTSQGPHNIFLATGFATGLPGLGLFLLACCAPLVLMFRRIWPTRRASLQGPPADEHILGVALCAVFLSALLTQGMFEGRSWPPIAFWLGASLAWLNRQLKAQ